MKKWAIILSFVLLTAGCLNAESKIQTLILSGRSNHEWRQSTPQLKKLLEQSGRFEVRVNEEPAACTSGSLAKYDVLIVDYHGPRWNAECERAIVSFVAGGKGLVSVHGAIYGFGNLEILAPGHKPTGQFQPPWTEYAKMLGGSWPQPAKPSYHGQRHIYQVRITGTASPITSGMPATFSQNDELYHYLKTAPDIGASPGLRPGRASDRAGTARGALLATAFDDPKIGGSGRDEPILWTVTYGEGRVFTTVLGHDLEAMTSAGFMKTFVRGTEWAATGAVADPAPNRAGAVQASLPEAKQKPISALVVTGGHSYESSFYTLFEGYPDLKWDHAVHGVTAEGYVRGAAKDLAKNYDVLVMYDMVHESTAEQRENLMRFVKAGKGVVMLHHAIASFPAWPEYEQLVGGKYLEKAEGGRVPSTYAHDQDMIVRVVDRNHPVTRGLPDFELNDETYRGMAISPNVHLLLTTDHPKADRPLAWITPNNDAREVSILLGHGPGAYNSPAYRRLVYQAIRWAARRE